MYFLILGRIHAWSGWGLLVFSLGSITNSVLSVLMKKLCGAIWWFHQFPGLTHEACWLNPLWFRCGQKNPIAKPLAKLPVTDAFDDRFVMGSNLYFSSMWGLPFCVKMFPMTVHHTGIPVVHSGLSNMTVLKTTQSGFEGFLRDRFTTLQDARDRCFCTSLYARWRYNMIQDVNFDAAWWLSVKDMKNTAFTIYL